MLYVNRFKKFGNRDTGQTVLSVFRIHQRCLFPWNLVLTCVFEECRFPFLLTVYLFISSEIVSLRFIKFKCFRHNPRVTCLHFFRSKQMLVKVPINV